MDKIFNKASLFDDKNLSLIKENGVVFTDKKICDKMINELKPNITDKICEPSFGKGIFIFSLLEYFRKEHNITDLINFVENNLYGYEINNDFVEEYKILIHEYFQNIGYFKELKLNIFNKDFLTCETTFDIIIGNPPYVKIQNIDEEYLTYLKDNYNTMKTGNVDLYYAFIEKSLKISKRVCLITPNTFIKSKSSNKLRELLIGRINKIFDFGIKKIWANISTYTAIFICEEKSDEIIYKSKNISITKKNNELKDKWVFTDDIEGDTVLYELINYHNMSIQTSANDIFMNETFEEGIYKKYIKATKSETFEDYKMIIYPYDEQGKVMEEEYIKEKYPKCYHYLLENKEKLINRNMPKDNKWYEYGRTQGLIMKRVNKRVILPNLFKKSKGVNYIIIPNEEDVLIVSGILVDVKDLDKFLNIIRSDHFVEWCENNNKTLPDADPNDIWISITPSTLKKYRFSI